ncbi:MAG TPA: tetratricopeptide repeat protein [Longimicrobiales bacterium]
MARHPTARRVHHDAVDPDDAFIARILQLTAWFRTHARALGFGAALLVVAVILGMYYRNFQATARVAAESRFAAVQQSVVSGNHALAIRDLEAFLKDFGGTPLGDEARVLLGQSYLAQGDPQKAIAAVDPVAGSIGEGMGTTAALLKAAALEASNQPQQAETLYLRIADRARFDYERQDALDAAARIRMERGDAAGAAELYERLVELAGDGTVERSIYEMRLAEARTRAQN